MQSSKRSSPSKDSANFNEDILVFVVHGMGQRRHKFMENLGYIGSSTRELADLFFHEKENRPRFHYVPIEWHMALHQRHTVDARINLISLPTVSYMRYINNEYMADVLLYYTPYHGRKILEIVVNEINRVFEKSKKEMKHFKGRAILLGHSLGGVICYDILCNQPYSVPENYKEGMKMKDGKKDRGRGLMHIQPSEMPKLMFKPEALVAIGSPIAAVMVQRGQIYDQYHLPHSIPLYNVFHPYDLIAYRFEPLIDPRYTNIEPVLAKHWNNEKFHVDLASEHSSEPSSLSRSDYWTNLASMMPNMPSVSLSSSAAGPLFNLARDTVQKRFYQVFSYFNNDHAEKTVRIRHEANGLKDPTAEPPTKKQAINLQIEVTGNSPDMSREYRQTDDEFDVETHPNRYIDVLESIAGINQNPVPTDRVSIEQPSLLHKKSPLLHPDFQRQHEYQELEQWDLDDALRPPFAEQLRDTDSSCHKNEDKSTPSLAISSSATSVDPSILRITDRRPSIKPATIDRRIDYVLQVNLLDHYSHEYLAGIPAHFSYWRHKDVPFLMLRILYPAHFRNIVPEQKNTSA